MMGTVTYVGEAHDALLYQFQPSNPPPVSEPENFRKPHHWIEEGSFEDFRLCILASDLPWLYEIGVGTGSFSLMGTVTGRIVEQGLNADTFVIQNFATIERRVIETLMNRPEVRAYEPKTKALVAQAP